MCGVAGVLAPNAKKEDRFQIAWRLLLNTQIRGRDSTGIGFYDQYRNPIVVKAPVKAEEFVKLDDFHDRFMEHDPSTFILHCRAKTKGSEKQSENNHPVYSKQTGIMLVHNGRVQDDRWRTTYEDGSQPYLYTGFDAEVDTEAALRMIETMRFIPRDDDGAVNPERVRSIPKEQWTPQVSWAKAIDDATFNLGGTYVLNVMVPDEENTVYLVRHDNPITVAWVPALEGIVWASTKEILEKSLTFQDKVYGLFSRNRTLENHQYEIPNNHMLRFTMGADGVPEWEMFELKPGMGNPFAFSVTKDEVARTVEA